MGLSGFLHRIRHADRLRRIALGRETGPEDLPACLRCDEARGLLQRIVRTVRAGVDAPLPDEAAFRTGLRARIAAAASRPPVPEPWSAVRLRPALAGAGFALALLALSAGLQRSAPSPSPVLHAESVLFDLDAGGDVPAELDLDAILSDPELAADLAAA